VPHETAPDLGTIRDQLDLVDQRAHGMAVVDRPREQEMLDKIGTIAAEGGLDPRIARQVLRAVIDAFTILEVEQLGPDV
jgi:chorismate mutase